MNGFHLPELIVESIIRDGIKNCQDDPTVIDNVFAQLTRAYATKKYGAAEITKIKAMIIKPLNVVFSYHELDANVPCFSIMIGEDSEDRKRAHLDDDYGQVETAITDPTELAALVRVDNITGAIYYPQSGKLSIPDSANLSQIYANMLFVDASDQKFPILGGISDVPGDKSVFIQKNMDQENINLTGICSIRSSLDYEIHQVRGVTSDVKLVIGCHSKDALTTKYLYLLLKYFILSRKHDLISRDFYLASYSGSDFTRDQEYQADKLYTRFLTVTGKVDDCWDSDQVVLIDNIEIDGTPVDLTITPIE